MNTWLQTKTWKEAKEAIEQSKGVAVLSIGSVEQHSYHLPVGTDSYVAIALAEEACQKTNALLVPPIWFGWSPHHMVLPGTITIKAETMIALTYDVIASLKHHGITKFVLINGHRIVNVIWMQLLGEKVQRELDVTVKIFDPAYMSKDIAASLGFGPVGHAEEAETSHMLYIHPELVHMELAKDNPIKEVPLYSVDPAYTHDTLCYVPSKNQSAEKNAKIAGGTTGEPTKASAEKGKIYHEHLMKHLITVIEELQGQ